MHLPLLFRVALALLCASFVLFMVGFSTHHWFSTDILGVEGTFGLWIYCGSNGTDCISLDSNYMYTEGHLYLARGCGFLQGMGCVAAAAALFIFAFKEPSIVWPNVAYLTAICGGGIGLLGALIFVAVEKLSIGGSYESLSWSGVLVLVSGAVQVGAGLCVMVPTQRGLIHARG